MLATVAIKLVRRRAALRVLTAVGLAGLAAGALAAVAGPTGRHFCVDSLLGSDANSGSCSPYRPWASIARVNEGPRTGGRYRPGDTIVFAARRRPYDGTLRISSRNYSSPAARSGGWLTITSRGELATISSGGGVNVLA